MAISKAKAALAVALVLLAAFITRQVDGLKQDRDKALEKAARLETTLSEREKAFKEQQEAVRALKAAAAANEAVLLGWSALRRETQATYERQENESRKALAADADYARWSAAALPVRLLPGGGLLGPATDADSDAHRNHSAPTGADARNPGAPVDGQDQRRP